MGGVMSGNGHITEAGKKLQKNREWFERKVKELGEALQRLPADRRRQAEIDTIGKAPTNPKSDFGNTKA